MALPIIALALGTFGGMKLAESRAGKKTAETSTTPTTPKVAETVQQAEARIAAEQQVTGQKKSRQAAAFLKSRNAQGFGANPNVAKPFLLSL